MNAVHEVIELFLATKNNLSYTDFNETFSADFKNFSILDAT